MREIDTRRIIDANGMVMTEAILGFAISRFSELTPGALQKMEMSRIAYHYFHEHFHCQYLQLAKGPTIQGVLYDYSSAVEDGEILFFDDRGEFVGKIVHIGRMFYTEDQILKAAVAGHEANRILCLSLGDTSVPDWRSAPSSQQASIISGVKVISESPWTTPAQQHAGWLSFKEKDGWKYGPAKDTEKKEHPCFVPYEQLPENQKLKDHLFGLVVRAVLGLPLPAEA